MGASGSINFLANSGSHYDAQPSVTLAQHLLYHKSIVDFARVSTTTTTEELTVKYYQRVFDAGLSVYCYYTKTSIDATPLSTETSPEYTGAISDHSVVKILEIY